MYVDPAMLIFVDLVEHPLEAILLRPMFSISH
jgi:hypothetical protein